MDTTVVIVILGLVLAAVVVFFVMRSRKSATPIAPDEPAAPPAPRPPVAPTSAPPTGGEPLPPAPPVAPRTPSAPSNTELPAPPPPVAAGPSAAVALPVAAQALPPLTKRDVATLRKGLQQTRGGWVQRLFGIFGGKKEIDPELVSEIEEVLLTGDVGVKTTQRLTETLKDRLSKADLSDQGVVWSTLRNVAREVLDVGAPPLGSRSQGAKPTVLLVVGVNGVGKTTTIGKLAARYKEQGQKVLLAAGDTFRAAAVAQLEAWGRRVGVPVVKGKDASKPGAVIFDAVQTGVRDQVDIVIADTAGRLHTKAPLMDELRKVRDAAAKAMPGAPHEILLVLDATTGQNGVVQVKEFREALELTGIVLTKLDGTAKGGVILGICDEFQLPVRFIGVGEKVDDLREFDAEEFTEALFSGPVDESESA